MGPGPDDIYTRLQIAGKDVGALYPMRPEQRQQGVPPNWLPYVTVDLGRRDGAEGEARSAATSSTEPFDVMTFGRMAIVQDPTGGHVRRLGGHGAHRRAARQRRAGDVLLDGAADARHRRRPGSSTPGSSAGTPKTAKFDSNYTEFWRGEVPVGGMMAISKEMGDVPPNWGVYWHGRRRGRLRREGEGARRDDLRRAAGHPERGPLRGAPGPAGGVFSIFKPAPRRSVGRAAGALAVTTLMKIRLR